MAASCVRAIYNYNTGILKVYLDDKDQILLFKDVPESACQKFIDGLEHFRNKGSGYRMFNAFYREYGKYEMMKDRYFDKYNEKDELSDEELDVAYKEWEDYKKQEKEKNKKEHDEEEDYYNDRWDIEHSEVE